MAESLRGTLNSWKTERKSFEKKSCQAFKAAIYFYIGKFSLFLAKISAGGSTELSSTSDEANLEIRVSIVYLSMLKENDVI